MDTSISKALIMVASVLLAMIVIAFITFSFRRMGQWTTTSDDELLTKQKDKFNKEYEVYDKDLMYGVDVISCLNKALSNNDKITEVKYVTGDTYDQAYEIKVKVTLKSNAPLEESITVYHMNETSKKEVRYENDEGPQNVKISDVGFNFINTEYFNKISNIDKSNDTLKTIQEKECKGIRNVTEFNLTKDKNSGENGEQEIRALLSVSNAISEIVKNSNKVESAKENSWTKAEFRSALYDLKTRRFKCVQITYSETGRVNYIEFKEI